MLVSAINNCENLELIPLEKEKAMVKELLEYFEEDLDEEQRDVTINGLFNREYAPYCKKRECPCVVCESPVLLQRYHGFGNFHQPMKITLVNDEKIIDCQDRKIPRGFPEIESTYSFLLTHIKTD